MKRGAYKGSADRRLNFFNYLKFNSPVALSDAELAEVLGLSKRSVERYIRSLRNSGSISIKRHRYKLDGWVNHREITVLEEENGNSVCEGEVGGEGSSSQK